MTEAADDMSDSLNMAGAADVKSDSLNMTEAAEDMFVIWEYLVTNRDDPSLHAQVRAQIQKHVVIRNQIVFFQGECETRYGYLSQFDTETVLKLYTLLLAEKSFMTILPDHGFQVCPVQDTRNKDKADHVKINIKTCHPFVTCPVTGQYWKECIGPYDVSTESYLRDFRRYCVAHQRYPESAEDLLVFISESYREANHTHKNLQKRFTYFRQDIYDVLESVLDKFAQVKQTLTCQEYLDRASKYYFECARRIAEKTAVLETAKEIVELRKQNGMIKSQVSLAENLAAYVASIRDSKKRRIRELEGQLRGQHANYERRIANLTGQLDQLHGVIETLMRKSISRPERQVVDVNQVEHTN